MPVSKRTRPRASVWHRSHRMHASASAQPAAALKYPVVPLAASLAASMPAARWMAAGVGSTSMLEGGAADVGVAEAAVRSCTLARLAAT